MWNLIHKGKGSRWSTGNKIMIHHEEIATNNIYLVIYWNDIWVFQLPHWNRDKMAADFQMHCFNANVYISI